MTRIERIILRHMVDAARRRELGSDSPGPRPAGDVPPVQRPGDWMPVCSTPNIGHPRKVRASGGAREALDRAREAWGKLDMQLPMFPTPLESGPEAVRASQLDRRR